MRKKIYKNRAKSKSPLGRHDPFMVDKAVYAIITNPKYTEFFMRLGEEKEKRNE